MSKDLHQNTQYLKYFFYFIHTKKRWGLFKNLRFRIDRYYYYYIKYSILYIVFLARFYEIVRHHWEPLLNLTEFVRVRSHWTDVIMRVIIMCVT